MDQELRSSRRRARSTIASYRSYAEAQQAVDYLSDRKFPVERLTIVAEGLSVVEQVTGRLGYGRALLNGVFSGAATGALFGFIFGLFDWITPVLSGLTLALYGLVYGAIVGAVLGFSYYTLSQGRRDFTSVTGMQADHYNIDVDDEAADEASQLLAGMGSPNLQP